MQERAAMTDVDEPEEEWLEWLGWDGFVHLGDLQFDSPELTASAAARERHGTKEPRCLMCGRRLFQQQER